MPVSPSQSAGTTAVTGGSYLGPTAGSSVDSSGPWYIETQTLNFEYVRVPNCDLNHASGVPLDLDSASASFDIAQTTLQIKGRAVVKVKKSYERFSASSDVQPQTFEVQSASSDYLGQSYGDYTASHLNCAGEVNTVNKWYFRRPWVSGVDEEFVSAVQFFTVYRSSLPGIVGERFGKYPYWEGNEEIANIFIGPYYNSGDIVKGLQMITKNGPFTTSQDTASDVKNLIDDIGDLLANGKPGYGLWPRRPENVNDIVILEQYDINRHDYT